MSETLVYEKKFKVGGFKLYTDHGKKLVRSVWSGKYDAKEIVEVCEAIKNVLMKFNKGEAVYLHDISSSDMKYWTPEFAKVVKEETVFIVDYSKKTAYVTCSYMHKKADETARGTMDNLKYFTTEQEAMKWLMA